MNRRRFLRQSGAAAVLGSALGPGASRVLAAARAAGVPDAIGIQLYSLRDVLPGDVNGVLEMLSRYGYASVETAGYADREPEAFAAALGAYGLAFPSGHALPREIVPTSSMADDLDPFDEILGTFVDLGYDYFVVPWLPEDARPDRDGYLRMADTLNRLGERSRAAGVQLGYHNHDFEFDRFGTDRPAYFDFVERLDPDLVVMELDIYWSTVADIDAVDLFERYPGRFPLWHVKDGSGPDMTQTDVGAGVIDWPRVFAAAETAGLVHAIIEADHPPDGDALAFAVDSIGYVDSIR